MFRVVWEERIGDWFHNEDAMEMDVSAEEAKEEALRGLRNQMELFDDWDRNSEEFVLTWNDMIDTFSCWVEKIEREGDRGVKFWEPSAEELASIGWKKIETEVSEDV